MRRGSNLERVGSFNQVLVLDLIRRAGEGTTRVELTQTTGLSAQTVSNIARRLLELGLVTETGKVSGGMGKPRTVLAVDPTSRYAVGVHLDPSIISLVLLDLSGSVAARSHILVDTVASPAQTVAQMSAAVEELVSGAGIERERVLGVGIASPGPIDFERGVLLGPPLLDGWERVPLRESLRTTIGLPVFLEKDSTAAAHAELWISENRPGENFALVYMGTGLGAGLVLGGSVARGASNNVGEIGHLSTGADRPVCSCGRRGCVGIATMPAYLVSEAVACGALKGPFDPSDLQAVARQFRKLGQLADAGEARAVAILDTAGQLLARAIEDMANLLDVDRIVFGGPSWLPVSERYLGIIRQALATRLAAGMVHQVELVDSALGPDITAIGAGCVVLDNALAPRTGDLQLTG